MPLDFNEWREKEWLGPTGYHQRMGEIQKLMLEDTYETRELKNDLKELEKKIHELIGNGQMGIIDQKIEKAKLEITKDISNVIQIAMANAFKARDEAVAQVEKEKKAQWEKLKWIIIAFMVPALFGFVYQAVYFYFRLVPFIESMK